MIRIRVNYCAQARAAAGVASDDIELDGARTPADLLAKAVFARGEKLRRILLDENARPHPSVLVFANGKQLSLTSTQPLLEGDEVEIVPPISGG